MRIASSILLASALLPLASARPAEFEPRDPALVKMRESLSFHQKLNAQVPLDLEFMDSEGMRVKLGDKFPKDRPVILTLVYFECPSICNVLLNALVKNLREQEFSVGKDFSIVTVSFNHRETHVLADKKRANYLKEYGREGADAGWSFLVGDEANIKALAGAVGFPFTYNAQTEQYAHPAGIVLLTPGGKVSSYLFDYDWDQRQLRHALVQASENRIGTLVDRIAMMCYAVDPKTGKYTILISRVVMAACLTTVGLVGFLLMVLFKNDASRRPPAGPGGPQLPQPGHA
ncbi:MAG: SCO family protein [Kiritimatiellia bacterium]